MSRSNEVRLPNIAFKMKLHSSNLLYWGLLVLLILSYVLLIYTVTIALALSILDLSLEAPTPWWLDGIAFGLITIGFWPVSYWLSIRVNELVYGEYDNPYTLIARLNKRLQTMTNPAYELQLLTSDIAAELHLPYVAVLTMNIDPAIFHEAGTPPQHNNLTQIPIYYLDEQVGELIAAPRKRGQSLSTSDLHMLRDISRQIGVALHAARLM
jgi:two-component system NarL family sensor kinase